MRHLQDNAPKEDIRRELNYLTGTEQPFTLHTTDPGYYLYHLASKCLVPPPCLSTKTTGLLTAITYRPF